MDESKEKNTQTPGQFSQVIFQFPKKSIRILLSISALSILVSCTPFLPLFSHFVSSTFCVQLFSYTTDRNCVFLFCNGILAFLITKSARAGTDTNNNHQNIKQASVLDHQQSEPGSAVKKRALPSEGVKEVKDEELGRGNEDLAAAEEEEEEFLTAEEDEFPTVEEEEEEGIGLLSTEELNRKCDDFIRKVREGIKIEAQTVDHIWFSL